MTVDTEGWWSRQLRKNLRIGGNRDVRLAAALLDALFAGFLAYIARMHEVTHDAFHEMALFRESLLIGSVPDQELFAFSPTVQPSVHHEWATGAVLYFATIGTGLGVAGLSLLKFSTVALIWLILYRIARMRGAHPLVFAAFSAVVFPLFWVGFATVRAQLFTLLFLSLQMLFQQWDWRGRRAWIVAWLAMLVVWLNMHAGFVVGLGMMAFHGLARVWTSWKCHQSPAMIWKENWHLFIAAPLAAMATLINPYGWEYVPYLVRAITMDRPQVTEWQPLWHTYAPGLTLAAFAISLVLLSYAAYFSPRHRQCGLAFLVLCGWMTIKHIRHGSLYGLVWLAYVPAWLSRSPLGKWFVEQICSHRRQSIACATLASCAFLVFACAHSFWRPTLPPRPTYSTACFPTQAIAYLRQTGFEGNLLTPFHVGAYVSWELYPRVLVSFDGRYEVAYQDHVMDDHNRFLDAESGWQRVPEEYGADAVLVHRQADVAAKILEATLPSKASDDGDPATWRGWKLVYVDDAFLIAAREQLPLELVDLRGQALPDGAAEAFSSAHAHWQRLASPLAQH